MKIRSDYVSNSSSSSFVVVLPKDYNQDDFIDDVVVGRAVSALRTVARPRLVRAVGGGRVEAEVLKVELREVCDLQPEKAVVPRGQFVRLVVRYAQGANDLFRLSNQVFSVFLAPITLPMIAGVLFRPISKRAGLTALAGGITLGLVLFFLAPWLSATFQGLPDMRGELPMTWFSTITTVILLFVGTLVFPDKADEKPGLDAFFARIEER